MRSREEQSAFDAIKLLQVRGAPAIGVFAGYAMYVLAQRYTDKPYDAFLAEFRRQAAYLNSSRPTAVNLSWALKRQTKLVEDNARRVRRHTDQGWRRHSHALQCRVSCMPWLRHGNRADLLWCREGHETACLLR